MQIFSWYNCLVCDSGSMLLFPFYPKLISDPFYKTDSYGFQTHRKAFLNSSESNFKPDGDHFKIGRKVFRLSVQV